MNVIDGGNGSIEEPDWSQIYSDVLELDAARKHWAEIIRELRASDTLAPVNGQAIERVVNFRLIYARALQHVAEHGFVIPPKRGSKTAIARSSPYWVIMREAASDLDRMEAELGLSPRRRGAVTKVDRKARARVAADDYLKLAT